MGTLTLAVAKAGDDQPDDVNLTIGDDGSIVDIIVDARDWGQIMLANLPTKDPRVRGAAWNSAGTVKISAG